MSVPEVVFNMDLANAPTGERFCFAAAAVLGQDVTAADADTLSDRWGESVSEVVDDWSDRLSGAGYYAHWDCGDVVVYDLRPLSDEERESFFDSFA